ncbi:MAG: DUF4276 family protein [Candidatus Coatesbacteria bacterium]|nr:DUF4276 family protein [Candidatus Coatesbacteria bacterium]
MRVPRRRRARGFGKGPKRTKIFVLCEGDTEMVAIRHFIRPYWESQGLKSVSLHPVNLWGKLDDIFGHVVRARKDPKVMAIFTLIDLYEMKRVIHRWDASLDEKVGQALDWLRIGGAPPELKDEFGSESMRDFYRPHLSVHEVEAWLLADGSCIHQDVKPLEGAEEKDMLNPPKARVKKLLSKMRRQVHYSEVIDGIRMFQKARFDVVYESCPYFKAFYDDLESVTKTALQSEA